MLFSISYYRDLISRLGIPEMPINEVKLDSTKICNPSVAEISLFIKKLMQFSYYNNMNELIMADFNAEIITQMGNGIVPENIDIVFKIPLKYGGGLDFSNVFIVKRHPFKNIINQFFAEQFANISKEILPIKNPGGFKMPSIFFYLNPIGIVFIPALKGIVSPGGNTSADIMSEIGSQMFMKSDSRL